MTVRGEGTAAFPSWNGPSSMAALNREKNNGFHENREPNDCR